MTVGIAMVVAIEGLAIHLWIAPRSQGVAWTITILNVAALVYIWREYQAGQHMALRVGAHDVEVSVGKRMLCRFPRAAIGSAEVATWRSVPEVSNGFLDSAKPLDPNILILLREPVNVQLSLGLSRQVTRLALRVQDVEGALAALRDPERREGSSATSL